jgi:DNA polymerase-3 subunit epsilon
MISIDCEMTGLNPERSAIISIGALDLKNPTKRIYIEMRPFEGADINEESIAYCGYSREDLENIKLSQKEGLELLKQFLDEGEERNVLGQNVTFDVLFLNYSFLREEIDCKIPYRVLDMHSMVCAKLLLQGKAVPIEERKSTLNLDTLLNMSGIPEEPKPHNALTGALSAAEVYFRLIEGRAVLPEFSQYPYNI